MQAIRDQFEVFGAMSDHDWDFFQSRLTVRTIAKGKHLLESGSIENQLSYVQSGIVRLYIPYEDHDVTFGFVFSDQFVSAYDSFLTRLPSSYGIQALIPTTIYSIDYAGLQEVYQQTNAGNLIGRRHAEQLFLIKSKRELSLLTSSAEERYLSLFKERPDLIRNIPLKYIASYIGVTPQALSRIRKRIIS